MKPIFTLTLLLSMAFSGKTQYDFHYTPKPDMNLLLGSNNFCYGDYSLLSRKHAYRVVFKDGRDTVLTGRIQADSCSYSLIWTDRSVKRNTPGRTKKIRPAETRYIARMDRLGNGEYKGMSSDTCWLFEIIDGPVNAYSSMSEDYIPQEYLLYARKGTGPLLTINEANLGRLLRADEKALRLVAKKKYARAIEKYNRDISDRFPAPNDNSQVSSN